MQKFAFSSTILFRPVLGLVFFCCMAFVTSCEEETETLDFITGLDYFPVEQGFWLEYQVDSVLYSPLRTDGKDSVSVQVRETYGEVFIDNEGREAMTVERQVRQNAETNWSDVTPTIWYVVQTDDQVERVEGELRFMKLIFPVFEGRTWDGNAFLNTNDVRLRDYRDWSYQYLQVAQGSTVNEMSFAETLTVSQVDREDLVNKTFAIETYAKDVGLVKKEEWILKRNDTSSGEDWPQRAETGYLMIKTLTDYKR